MEKNIFRKGIVLAIIGLFIGASFVLVTGGNELKSDKVDWWHSNWNYRKEINITNPISDYQMWIKVWKEDGYDDISENSIDCEDNCNANFSDIRFVDSTGILLPYWIEKTSIDSGNHYAVIWVNTSGDDSIYMYYGNPTASPVSNGYDTFIFFDNFNIFDTDIWDEYDPHDKITVTVEDGLLHIEYGSVSTGRSAGVTTKESVTSDGILVSKSKGERGSNPWNMPYKLMAYFDSDNYMENIYRHTGDNQDSQKHYTQFKASGVFQGIQYSSEDYSSLEWRILYLKKLLDFHGGGGFTDYYNGNRIGTEVTWNYPTTGDAFNIWLTMRSFNSGLNGYVDWVFVAKYCSTEPIWESFGDEQLLAGLVACWHFDEGTGGIAYDSSGNGNDGAIYGAEWTDGVSGQALSFDGVNDYIEVPYTSSFYPDEISIELWFNIQGIQNSIPCYGNYYSVLLGTSLKESKSYHFLLFQNQSLKVYMWNQTSYTTIMTPPLLTNEWYYIVVTFDGSTMNLYLNGNLLKSKLRTNPIVKKPNDLIIGNEDNSYCNGDSLDSPFYGFIDEVSIYNYALSASAIEVNYNTFRPIIDIKPGSYPNSINPNSRGNIPVAVLTNGSFYANAVNPDTIVFLDATPVKWIMEDVDNDGDMDLILHFKTQELNFSLLVDEGDDYPYAYLYGETYDEKLFYGKDTINLVGTFSEILERFFYRFPLLRQILQPILDKLSGF